MSFRALPLALLVVLLPACDDTVGPDGNGGETFAYDVSVFAPSPGEVTGIVGLNDLGQALVETVDGFRLRDGDEWVEVPITGRLLTDEGVVVGFAEGFELRTFEQGIVTDLGEARLLGVDNEGRVWANRDGAVSVRIGDVWEERTFELPDRNIVTPTKVGGSGILAGRFIDPGPDDECFVSDGSDWTQIGNSISCNPVEIENSGLVLVTDVHGGGSWTVWDTPRGEGLPINEIVGDGEFGTGQPFDMNNAGTVVGLPNAASDPLLVQRADTLYDAGVLFDTAAWSVGTGRGAAINDDGEILVMGSEAGSDDPLLLLLTPTQ